MFYTTQYTAATCQAVVISLRQTKLNENSELSSEGKSLPIVRLELATPELQTQYPSH